MPDDPRLDPGPLSRKMRSLSSLPETRLEGAAALINHLLTWVPMAGAGALYFWVRQGGPLWALIPAIASIALGVWLGGRHFKRAWMAQNERDTTTADELVDDGAPIILRRRLEPGWPLALTLIAAFFAGLAVAMGGAYGIMVVISLPLLIVAVIWWIFAARRTRPLGVVSADGLRMGDELFPWDRVGVSAESPGGPRQPRELVVTIAGDPREFRISLSRLAGTPAVIHQVIENHVQRCREERIRAAAAREAQAVRERFEAHPEQRETMAREFRDEIERDIAGHRAHLAAIDAKSEALRSRSFWSVPPGARPMKGRWLIIGGIGAWLALCAFGLKTDFYKSASWGRISLYVSVGMTVIVSIWVLRAMRPHIARRGRLGVNLVMPFILAGALWLPLANALPDVYTRLGGKPFSVETEMRFEYVRDKSCRLRIYAPLFDTGNLASYYCASLEEFEHLAEKESMRVRGRETWFGRHVDVIEPI